MSLREKLKKAKENSGRFKIPEGTYSAKFKDFKIGKSNNGDDMCTLVFKVREVLEAEEYSDLEALYNKIEESGKYIELKLLKRLDLQIMRMFEFIDGAGVDIETLDEEDVLGNLTKKALTSIEDKSPIVELFGKKSTQNPKYVNWYFNDIENVIGENIIEIDGTEYVWNDVIKAGWTVEQIKSKLKGCGDE
jgi:hypothetical protein